MRARSFTNPLLSLSFLFLNINSSIAQTQPSALQVDGGCNLPSVVEPQTNLSRDQINKILQAEFANMNIADFCRQTAKSRALIYDYDKGDDSKAIQTFEASIQDLKTAEALPISFPFSWQIDLYPHQKMRQLALDSTLYDVSAGISPAWIDKDGKPAKSFSTTGDGEAALRHFLETPGAVLENYPQDSESKENSIRKPRLSAQLQTFMVPAQKIFVCKNYGIFGIPNCVKALDRVLEIMQPGDGSVLWQLEDEVLRDPRYVEPARKAALKVYNRITRNDATGDLYSDIYSAFLESVGSATEAEEMSWKFLALTQYHGANSGMVIRNSATKKTRQSQSRLG